MVQRLSKFEFRAIGISRWRLRFEPEKALDKIGVLCVHKNFTGQVDPIPIPI